MSYRPEKIATAVRYCFAPCVIRSSVYCTIAALMVFAALPRVAAAAERQDTSGYVHDGEHHLIHSSFGSCVRTGYWTPALATAQCDPEFVKKVAVAQPAPPRPKAPPMATAPAPMPAKPRFEKTTLSEEDLFDFDHYSLKPAATVELDHIAERIRRSSELDSIRVTGYADRIGSANYNIALSQLRANAVRDYLVSRGIGARRITSVGKGEADPVAACAQIPGPVDKSNSKLVGCLQPNRRVEVQAFIEQLASGPR